MSGRTSPELNHHLLRLEVGLLLAMEHAVSAAQALHTHVCDDDLPCQLCLLADALAAANRRLGRTLDRVELHAEGLTDGEEVNAAFVRVRDLLAGLPPVYLATLAARPQRASSN